MSYLSWSAFVRTPSDGWFDDIRYRREQGNARTSLQLKKADEIDTGGRKQRLEPVLAGR